MDKQSRCYQITINNPDEKGYSDDKIEKIIVGSRVLFACYSHEIGESGTPHIHIYMLFPSPRRFSTMKRKFPGAHIVQTTGSIKENIEYIRKEGKFSNTAKEKTKVEGSYREFGSVPSSLSLEFSDMAQVIGLLNQEYSVVEIIREFPKYGLRVNAIEALRQAFLADKYKSQMRQIEVTYKYGATGTGKTRSIFQKYSPDEICRITSYGKNGVKFDSYKSEDVLVFEEFASQIPLEEMLVYLDIYPLMLPARYTDRVACYTKVIITSNLPLCSQYTVEQVQKPETYKAFQRRINYVETYSPDGTVKRVKMNDVPVFKDKDEKHG